MKNPVKPILQSGAFISFSLSVSELNLCKEDSDPISDEQSKLIPLTRGEHELARDTKEMFPRAGELRIMCKDFPGTKSAN